MKKIGSLLLVLMLLVALTACGGQNAPTTGGSMDVGGTTAPAPAAQGFDAKAAVEKYFTEMDSEIYKIDQKAFIEEVKAGKDMVVVDIRSKEDYDSGHIKGAINLPWGGTAIAEGLSAIPEGKPVYVYCYTGQTAGQAVTTFNIAGIPARSVNFGWNMGISLVDGYEAVTTKEATPATPGVRKIDPAVQEAMTAYYAGMGELKKEKPMFANYKISEKDLKELVDKKDPSIYIYSVRGEKDYLEGHIEGAVNNPFGPGMAAKFSELPKDKTIVVYCYTGQTSGQVTAALRLMGYDAVSLNGGMGTKANAPMGWKNQNYPVVK